VKNRIDPVSEHRTKAFSCGNSFYAPLIYEKPHTFFHAAVSKCDPKDLIFWFYWPHIGTSGQKLG
jgi:hypothetical protein